jgi:hypothetical protein
VSEFGCSRVYVRCSEVSKQRTPSAGLLGSSKSTAAWRRTTLRTESQVLAVLGE